MLSHKCYSLHAVCKRFGAVRWSPGAYAILFCCALWIGLHDCDASSPAAELSSVATQSETQGSLKQRQAAFLIRMRKADPEHRTFERAVFNEQNDLGLILSRSVELDKIPALMRSILTQMARAFPGQDLTAIAYGPSNPPRKIGTARLNARTRDMTYTPER